MAGLVSSNHNHNGSTDLGHELKCSTSSVCTDRQTDRNLDVPNTREILGAHLYQKVCECFPNGSDNPTLSQKLTGMLMECRTAELFLMLTDDHLLKMRIETAKLSLGDNPSHCFANNLDLNSDEKLDLGNQLFEKVTAIDSALSAQITGMLLELNQKTLEVLLIDNAKLREAVEISKQTFLKHHSLNINSEGSAVCKQKETTSKCTESNEELGDVLYDIVEKMYAKEAAQITGMLLEIEPTILQELLQDREQLIKKINMARKVLQSHLQNSL